jgi:putative OPT family oligopeptide transporter
MSHPPAQAPQLTVRAILLSVILAATLAAGNTYLGLFAGLTIASAIPAAVVSMGVLRALGGGGILENNIVATGASAGASIASGVIFTLPALIFLGAWQEFDYWWVFAIAGLGGLLGLMFSVPLRRSLVVEQKMSFPEGQAAAEVLKAGANPAQGIKVLGSSAAAGGLMKLTAESGLRLTPDVASWASFVGKGIAYVGTNLSPALLGVGYIVGVNVGAVMLAGGIIAWNIAIPIYAVYFLDGNPDLAAQVAGASPADAAGAIRGAQIRYLGVGAMLIGGVWTLFSIRKSILSGVRSGLAATRENVETAIAHTERDIPMKYVLLGIVAFTIPLYLLYHAIVGSFGVAATMTVIMIIAGFIFCSVSAYMAGLVGSSNNPVSGITICTLLFAALVLALLMGRDSASGPVAAIMIGAVVCCAACIAGDNLQDLKAGHIIGASPWRQQVMLGIGALACAMVMAPVLNLMLNAYGMGPKAPGREQSLEAAQATLMESVAKGMFGGELPWNMVITGMVVGAIIIAYDVYLKATGARFRAPVLAAAVGIYLPLDLEVPIFLGGLLAWYAERTMLRRSPELAQKPEAFERAKQNGTLFAAGLITGEALIGVAIAIPIVISERQDVLALPEAFHFGGWLGLLMLGGIAYWLFKTGTKTTETPRGESVAARG